MALPYITDKAVPLQPSVGALWISVITDREIQKVLTDLTARGLRGGSVRRVRASLRSFFEWAVRERIDRHDEHLPPPPPRDGCRSRRARPPERSGAHAGHADRNWISPRERRNPP